MPDQVLLTLDIQGKYLEGQGLAEWPKPMYPPEVYLPLTDATMDHGNGWVALTLRHLGFDGDFDNLPQLCGKFEDVLCKHETNLDGDPVERWSILRPAGARTVPPAEKKEVRRLN